MTTQELFLKTIFCCMACDGDIADEEINLVKSMASSSNIFENIDVEAQLNQYIEDINKNGATFLLQYMNDLSANALTPEEELRIVDLAIKTIEADKIIQYSEVKFFKKIRARLEVSDEQILKQHPDKEDFLLPDINVQDLPVWNDTTFVNIEMNIEKQSH